MAGCAARPESLWLYRDHWPVRVRRRRLQWRRRFVQGRPALHCSPVEGMQDVLHDLGSDAKVSKVTVAKDLSNLEEAKSAATKADLVILMAGLVASEGADLPSPNMINDQNRMLDELLEVNPRTVVVMKNSSPVMMPWITKAPAVLEAWNQGTEDGHVVADLLLALLIHPARFLLPTQSLRTIFCTPAILTLSGHRRRQWLPGYPLL